MQPRKQSGFSLLEMMIALIVLLVISAVTFEVFGRYEQRYGVELESANLNAQGVIAMDQMLHELRMAGYPSASKLMYGSAYNGTADNLVAQAPFESISATSLTMDAALGNTGTTTIGVTGPVVDQVIYTLNGSQLQRTYAPRSSTGPIGTQTTTTLASHVKSLHFNYYDSTGAVTATPANVAEVQVQMVLETTAKDLKTNLPMDISLQGTAYVRN